MTKLEPGIYQRNADGSLTLLKRQCSSPWGVGTYTLDDGEEMYGYGCTENPHDFMPDEECCTPAELAAWQQACAAWDARK